MYSTAHHEPAWKRMRSAWALLIKTSCEYTNKQKIIEKKIKFFKECYDKWYGMNNKVTKRNENESEQKKKTQHTMFTERSLFFFLLLSFFSVLISIVQQIFHIYLVLKFFPYLQIKNLIIFPQSDC